MESFEAGALGERRSQPCAASPDCSRHSSDLLEFEEPQQLDGLTPGHNSQVNLNEPTEREGRTSSCLPVKYGALLLTYSTVQFPPQTP
jgi:hypothetical protein